MKSTQMFFFVELFILVFYVHEHATTSLPNALKLGRVTCVYIQKEQYKPSTYKRNNMKMKSSQMFFFVELFILIFYVHKHISSEVFLRLNYSYLFSTYTSTSPRHFTTKTKHSQTHITTTNNAHRPSPRALPSKRRSQPILLAAAINLLHAEKPIIKQQPKEERAERSAAPATAVIRRTKAINGQVQKAPTIKMKMQAQMERLGMVNI